MISSTDKKIKKYEISGQEDSVTEIYQPQSPVADKTNSPKLSFENGANFAFENG